jgi:putative transposase
LNTPKGYYVAITVYRDKKHETKEYLPEIGIDMGCSTSITTSDGRKIDVKIEETERLKRLQREFSKRKKGSNNRTKTLKKIQREYQNITNKKNDAANKIVAELLEHEKVYMQDEQLSTWKKSGHGKAVQRSVLGRVKAKLVHNSRVVVLDRFVPTTKYCSRCGKRHDEMKLWDRTFECECGVSEDRDVHAAKNMVWFGKKLKVGQGLAEVTPMESRPLLSDENLVVSPLAEVGRSPLLSGG